MKISKRIAAIGALAVIGSGTGVAFNHGSEAAAPPPTAIGGHTVVCDTFFGAGKFTLPLDLNGLSLTDPTTLNVKGVLDGCIDQTDPAVVLAPSKVTMSITYADNFATALATPQVVTASATIGWKFAKTSVKTDSKATHMTWTAQPGATLNVDLTGIGLAGSYSTSSIPAGNITITPGDPLGSAFHGGDNGASTTFTQLLAQTSGALGAQLGAGGVKGVTIGAGNMTVG